ncbi:MAG: hypothetical protein AVDCRST_MAG05-2574 [uncultured Rubrobacteraceae bacterium]|uniref:Uncharacterized protein n=1 Tax=uncultured Rubrobacteraceae bacterium TaxID=349277 RepID=A0A6J4SRJ1_9ACTN|nr:MAG: hypothetical protein AVDCRST_MAG05-2574 [uncultured Rubrobacteraceae bacterium]
MIETKPTPIRKETMKAVVQDAYGLPAALELRDIARPEVGDDQVLVRVRAAGVNPADWAIMSGLPYIARPVYGLRTSSRRRTRTARPSSLRLTARSGPTPKANPSERDVEGWD